MKVVILNNTSRYHKGCEKVMEYLHKDVVQSGHQIVASVMGNKDTLTDAWDKIEMSDAVIVNGEGTMRLCQQKSCKKITLMQTYI